jgi:CRISPR-associated protein Csy2
MRYLTIPRLRTQAANIQRSAFLLGGPPVLAAWSLVHAIGRRASFGVGAVALIHHDQTLLGQQFNGVFSPQQRRGAAYTFEYKSGAGRDYSSKNEHALSLQPTASAHMTVSIIAEVTNLHSTNAVTKSLYAGRFSGGQIVDHREVAMFDSLSAAYDSISSGFCVMDRRDLLVGAKEDRHSAFVAHLGCDPSRDNQSWISATCVGYAALTPFQRRRGAREGYTHAFAEPLIGLVQYKSLRSVKVETQNGLWRPTWLAEDVFVVQQALNNQQEGEADASSK